jgi:hypothetical protein
MDFKELGDLLKLSIEFLNLVFVMNIQGGEERCADKTFEVIKERETQNFNI